MGQVNNNTKKRKFKHFSYTERTQIERWFNIDKKTKTEIAKLLNKNLRSVRREINNNLVENLNSDLTVKLVYSAVVAQDRYDYEMTSKGPAMILDDDLELCNFIENEIVENKKSPEVISLQLRNSERSTISARSIRNAIYKDDFFEKVKRGKIIYKKEYKSKNRGKRVCDKVPAEKSIEFRPEAANNRSEYGHWEGDLVIGTRKRGNCLFTLTERMTREEIIIKIYGKKASSVADALDKLERKYKKRFKNKFKSITFDNGVEFRKYELLEKSIYIDEDKRTEVYYAHPYCSGERGSNENANRLIRRFIPKGQSMEKLTDKRVKYIENWINNYPRKILNDLSSIEYKQSLAI